jgi:3-methyl-2-oxobutanoate hydroxymethyltransferase
MSTQTSLLTEQAVKRVTTQTLRELKKAGTPITMLTAYDYTMSRLLDGAGVDILLVGDSASNVMAGHETTLPITLEQMIYHCQCVVRGAKRALIIADLPFGTYQGNTETALASAVRMMKEGGAHALKLEGAGESIEKSIHTIVSAGIPVMGHLGLTPQSINQFGTYKVRAKGNLEAEKLKSDALKLQEAGVFGIVLEKIPAQLGAEVSKSLKIPTIGIGAGNLCDGQVLVVNDMLGMARDFQPRFVRRYAQLEGLIQSANQDYIQDVKSRNFPNTEESY